MGSDILRRIALSQVPRILGFGDRNPSSETYGCFDRYYWHYKLIDFPNSRFQESSLLLGLLYNGKFKDNLFYKNQNIHKWCAAAIKFWASIQKKNGSFDEAYPYEYSFCATAFSTYASTEAAIACGLQIENTKLKKAGDWLAKNNNLGVSNQMSAAAVALYNIYKLCGHKKYKVAAREKVLKLVSMQHPEGFFLEYGGYDIGYLSITLSFLGKYYKKTEDKDLESPLKKAVAFLGKNVNKDGSYDWRSTSRKTQYLYPYGFSIMKSAVLKRIENGLKANRILNPAWMDDRYCLGLTVDYLQTYLENANDN